MDASASSKDADFNDVYAYFLKVEDTEFPTPQKQKHSVIKYTKLPDFEYDSKGSWGHTGYPVQPQQRRLVTLENSTSNTSRSLKLNPNSQRPTLTANSNRKIVSIGEDDEYDLHPKFSSNTRKSSTVKSNRAIETEATKHVSNQNTSRLTPSKYEKDTKSAPSANNIYELTEATSKKSKSKMSNRESSNSNKTRTAKEKDTRRIQSASLTKTTLSKNLVKLNEKTIEHDLPTRAKLYGNASSKFSKKSVEKIRETIVPPNLIKKNSFSQDTHKKRKLPSVIHVPIVEKCENAINIRSSNESPVLKVQFEPDNALKTNIVSHHDMETFTESLPTKIDQITDMEGYTPHVTYKCIDTSDLQSSIFQEAFDKLDIPDVSLMKERDLKQDLFDLHSKSLPNLQIPPFKITDNRKEKSVLDTHYSKSTSYIISRATLTYKTQQEINFHVVENKKERYSNQSPSPVKYPINVVSVFKEEMRSKDSKKDISMKRTQESKSSKEYKNCVNEIKSLNSSYIPKNKKLLKPSDVINAIRVNNGLLQSVLVCEQFQRELNFIDSFFESLQFLESCSLSRKSYKNNSLDGLVNTSTISQSKLDERNSDYNRFLSKLENGANSDDETMASKNLFLLNILIRDEQRRAKNLLCVLKRREDALKDFTKSQILYLENKKRQENIDISALKKKQRGALLKLQHECGEMQRMRKALLSLSEKRKVALMKTKKDLELKLKNNVDVEQIILGKKKLKRSTVIDRASVPLKCFDLSSSGCDDSTTTRYASDGVASATEQATECRGVLVVDLVTSAEKSIQTGDSILTSTILVERSTNISDENFVIVDGGYLNILFQNLCLPQIFSNGKQYEVNREALKNIVDSTNSRNESADNWNDVVEKLMNQPKVEEDDKLSTPSTARSLVEEFEQYYKSLADEENVQKEEGQEASPSRVYESSDVGVQTSLCKLEPESKCFAGNKSEEAEACTCEDREPSPAGPLPVPAGAPRTPELVFLDEIVSPSQKSSNTSCTGSSASSQPPCDIPMPPCDIPMPPCDIPMPSCEAPSSPISLEPSHAEAEELRRQQLAIEREIKELEQQSRLLVVREIPDKPPPPYTPPVDARPNLQPFRIDDATHDKIRNIVVNATDPTHDPTDAFQVLVHDFCEETTLKYKLECSTKPWDACNLLPQKPPLEQEELIETTAAELSEVLTPATPSLVSGVSSRRTDHIDDILFSEWRRAEPEWTSLHNDEVLVKNQLFETIFQRILTETVDEYKRIVLSPSPPTRDKSLVF